LGRIKSGQRQELSTLSAADPSIDARHPGFLQFFPTLSHGQTVPFKKKRKFQGKVEFISISFIIQ
jgi:hypothetical protein